MPFMNGEHTQLPSQHNSFPHVSICDMAQILVALSGGPYKQDFRKSLLEPIPKALPLFFMKTFQAEMHANAK